MIEQIGEARGLGALLGQGVKRAAAELGRGTDDVRRPCQGHGSALPRSPRLTSPWPPPMPPALAAPATCTGHRSSWKQGAPRPDTGIPPEVDRFDNEGKGILAKLAQDKYSMTGSLVICVMLSDGMIFADYANLLEAIHGRALDRRAWQSDWGTHHQPAARLQSQLRHYRGGRQAAQTAARTPQ